MANEYYDNSDQSQRFQPGTTARADEVDGKFDQVATGFSLVEVDTRRALKFLDDGDSLEIEASALNRRNQIVGFDAEGALTLMRNFKWRGDFQAGTEYFSNDVIRDATSKNLYIVDVRHTSTGARDDSKMSIMVNVDDVQQLKDAAANKAAESAAWSVDSRAARDEARLINLQVQHYAQQTDGVLLEAQNYKDSAASSAFIAASDREISTGQRILAETAASEAAESEVLAEQHKIDAGGTLQANEDARDASIAAKGMSETARDKSQDWAENPVDTSVAPGQFSSLHHATKAALAETNARNSASAASTSEVNADTSETNASNSASAANTSEGNAATSETNAAGSASAAATAESNAATSASNASTSETNAGNSASAAATSETNAATSETNASNSETAAGTSASNAATSESNAAGSASAASNSASSAATSETNAGNSANAANTSESNAATSAANALSSESSAEDWAENPEDVEVSPGSFSALHWAAKAQQATTGDVVWSHIINKPATATRWPAWDEVTSKPGTYTPSTHTHPISEVVNLQATLNGKLDSTGKAVDSDKLDGVDSSGFARTSGTYAIRATSTTKADVGLGSVRNVSSYSQAEADAHFASPGSTTTTTSNKTLAAGEKCFVSASGLTITLPASPAVNTSVAIGVQSFTDTVIARNGSNIMGLAENLTIDKENAVVTLLYVSATEGWRIK